MLIVCLFSDFVTYNSTIWVLGMQMFMCICVPLRSFHWCVQNATIPYHSQELLPFLSVMYFFLPLFSTNYSSILTHLILPSRLRGTLNLVVPKFIYNILLGILFPSILCTCPNQRNLFNLIVSIIVGLLTLHKLLYWLMPSNFFFLII